MRRIPLSLDGFRLPCPWASQRISRHQHIEVTAVAGRRRGPKPPKRKRKQSDREPPRKPRVRYVVGNRVRIAVGRPGEYVGTLLAEIRARYPDGQAMPVTDEAGLRPLAEYAAGWQTSTEAAKAMCVRKSRFLTMAADPELVELAVTLDPDLNRRLWTDDGDEFMRLHGHDGHAVPEPEPQRRGICKTVRTGKTTTRGKPILAKIGFECWFGGVNLHRSPPVRTRGGLTLIQRWTEADLLGLPYPGDWGTKPYA